jgi:hypothetical protein
MSFKTNTSVVQSLVTSGVTAAVGTSLQAHSTLLDSVAGITLSGNGNKALIVNGAGTAISLSAVLGSAAFASLGTAVGNVPVLGTGGKLDSSILPAMDVVDVFTVADNTARDALVATKGDVAVVTSLSKTYIYSGSAWVELISPSSSGSVTSVAGKTGVVTLALSDLTDVTTTSAATGNVLRFNGTKFVNAVLSYNDLANLPALKPVATSGLYSDLTGLPTLFSGSYTDLTNKPVLFSGSYADLTNKPTLGTAAAKDTTFFAAAVHTHAISDVTGLQSALDAKITQTAADAAYAAKVHTHTVSQITDFGSAVDAKIAAIPAVDKSIASVSVVTSSTTADGTAQIIVVNGSAAVTVTLPASPAVGKLITIKDGAGIAGTSNVTIAGNSKNIDGAASVAITANYESATLVYNGTQWNLI